MPSFFCIRKSLAKRLSQQESDQRGDDAEPIKDNGEKSQERRRGKERHHLQHKSNEHHQNTDHRGQATLACREMGDAVNRARQKHGTVNASEHGATMPYRS